MNYLFERDFEEYVENWYSVEKCDQRVVRELLMDNPELADNFPMIAYEYTDDSVFESDVRDSKFLTDKIHEGTWFIIGSDDEVYCLINFIQHGTAMLEIDVLEVNKEYRGQHVASNVIDAVEDCASRYFKCVEVSPFDTGAMNFWEKMGYEESMNGTWRKCFDEEED